MKRDDLERIQNFMFYVCWIFAGLFVLILLFWNLLLSSAVFIKLYGIEQWGVIEIMFGSLKFPAIIILIILIACLYMEFAKYMLKKGKEKRERNKEEFIKLLKKEIKNGRRRN